MSPKFGFKILKNTRVIWKVYILNGQPSYIMLNSFFFAIHTPFGPVDCLNSKLKYYAFSDFLCHFIQRHGGELIIRTRSVFPILFILNVSTALELTCIFLAHLSQRLIGELIGYPWSGFRSQFQMSSSWKPLGQSKPNLCGAFLGRGDQKFI